MYFRIQFVRKLSVKNYNASINAQSKPMLKEHTM